MRVVEAYRFSSAIRPLLPEGADLEQMWSTQEAKDVLKNYIEEHELVCPEDKSMVILNSTLCDTLYKHSKKELKSGAQQGSFLTHDSKKNVSMRCS